jgi:hypothetical protein
MKLAPEGRLCTAQRGRARERAAQQACRAGSLPDGSEQPVLLSQEGSRARSALMQRCCAACRASSPTLTGQEVQERHCSLELLLGRKDSLRPHGRITLARRPRLQVG